MIFSSSLSKAMRPWTGSRRIMGGLFFGGAFRSSSAALHPIGRDRKRSLARSGRVALVGAHEAARLASPAAPRTIPFVVVANKTVARQYVASPATTAPPAHTALRRSRLSLSPGKDDVAGGAGKKSVSPMTRIKPAGAPICPMEQV